MPVAIKVPRLAESISEAVLVQWLKEDGTTVRADEPIAVLETDKAAVEIPADRAGVLRQARAVGETVVVGDVIANLEDLPPGAGVSAVQAASSLPPAVPSGATRAAPANGQALTPAVRRMVEEHGLDPAEIPASGRDGRLLKEDVQRYLQAAADPSVAATPVERAGIRSAQRGERSAASPAGGPTRTGLPKDAPWEEGEVERAVPMSRIRLRIAERLVDAQRTAAILTTFNEVDMTSVMELRSRYKESFEQRHGVKLSYMSFFTRASVLALQQIPEINAQIRGSDIVYLRHVHMGVAVQTDRGLVVPVVHEADQRSFADLEKEIARLAQAARENRLTLEELSGGTFTISNGGVFGSLLSTPILNPPQSGILGMHKIEKRPVVVDDQVTIRPMMYLALSYDHRIVDGEQAVTFLVSVKQRLEDPERMLLDV